MFKEAELFIKDYKGNYLFEGDIIQWPEAEELGIIRYEPNGCQFRIQFEDKFTPSCHVGLQMGEKGKAFKIGSVYGDVSLVPWAV